MNTYNEKSTEGGARTLTSLRASRFYREVSTNSFNLIDDSCRIKLNEHQGSILFNFYIVALLCLDNTNQSLAELIKAEISNSEKGYTKRIKHLSEYAIAQGISS